MHGMMIQDFSSTSEAVAPASVGTRQEVQEQPFGQVLGQRCASAQDGNKEQLKAEAEEPALQAETEIEIAETVEAQENAAPFFMSALADQSASLIKPSENAELVAAAERVQELVGQWLQAQEAPEETQSDVIAAGEQPEAEELMTLALELLSQAEEEAPTAGADSGSVEESTPLNDGEIEELRQLMAVMLQSGQAPQALKEHPLAAEVGRQLDAAVPHVDLRRLVKESSFATESEVAEEGLAVTEEVLTDGEAPVLQGAAGGLQEEQLAKMLKPRDDQPTLRQQHADKAQPVIAQEPGQQPVSSEEGIELTSEAGKLETLKPAEQNGTSPHLQAVAVDRPQSAPTAPVTGVSAKIMQLPSGQQVAENQLVDQVVTYLAGSSDGESGRMRLRLHPAELGSVRLDLIVEGDKVRAHLQAQSQQVQEVLDRHLPQLRDALQQQGLKIDEFRVDVQTGQDQARDERFAWQQDSQERAGSSPWLDDEWPQPELEIPLAQLLEQNSGGISLRV